MDVIDGGFYPTRDGGYILAGHIMPATTDDSDVWVLKLDRDCTIEWTMTYGESYADEVAGSIEQTADGGYIVSGSQRYINSLEYHPLIMKLSETGDIQWQKAFGSDEKTLAHSTNARQASDGGYYLVDTTSSQGTGTYDVWVIKLSINGIVQWQRLYGGEGSDWARDVLPMQDGGCLISAYTASFGRWKEDYWLLKLDSRGDIEWQKAYGMPEYYEFPFSIYPNDDGDYFVTGHLYTDIGRVNMMIIKVAPDGNLGPCSLVKDTQATVTVSSIAESSTKFVQNQINVVVRDTSAIPQPTNEFPVLICSNLHQPPTNISITRDTNRSLFVKEYYNQLTWEPDSWNNRFNILEYRIYRKEISDLKYQLLASVDSKVFAYLDAPIDSTKEYQYVLTSVDDKGRESPRSVPLKGY